MEIEFRYVLSQAANGLAFVSLNNENDVGYYL